MNIKKNEFKTNNFNRSGFNQKGFTLMELLISIAIIGVLSGVVLSVVNVDRQKDIAEDAVRVSNLEKMAQGIMAYTVGEGSYPLDSNNDGNPLNSGSGTNTTLAVYMNTWNDIGSGDQIYNYYYRVVENLACLSVNSAVDNSRVFKYVSGYNSSTTGGRSECASVVVVCDGPPCGNSGNTGNDLGPCETLSGVSCN